MVTKRAEGNVPSVQKYMFQERSKRRSREANELYFQAAAVTAGNSTEMLRDR